MVLEMEMSKTYQYRKVMKPLLERKRRARINKCLDELKDLMVECLTEEGEHVTRLEKADILELTVEHLRKTKDRKQQLLTDSFRTGYIQAANEVSKALAAIPGIDITLGTKLMTHLGHQLNTIQTSANMKSSCPSMSTSTSTLNIVCDGGSTAPLSPASSGYESEMDIQESIPPKGLLKLVKVPAQSNRNDMWRPW